MPISYNEINSASKGGTEMMARRLDKEFTEKELAHVQIIPSRVRELDDELVRVFWCHDLPGDPESEILKDGGWRKFEKLVFVSYWQKQRYIDKYSIPYDKCTVLLNAIDPISSDCVKKDFEKIRLIYHTTPHRGLDVAYHAVDRLVEKYPEIEFNVYSSFQIYGWGERDNEYQELYNAIDNHPNMNYHGTVSNEKVRKTLEESHIFAYPSVWPETSCISLMEAMSAKCLCVHSDLGALPETAANWTYMYNVIENKQQHTEIFASCLDSSIEILKSGSVAIDTRLMGAKSYADLFYSWEMRKVQWDQFLTSLRDVTPKPVQELAPYEADEFVYNVG